MSSDGPFLLCMPDEYEERIALIESIANAVLDETMPARAAKGLSTTDDARLVRSIVDKVVHELEGTSDD